MNTTSHPLYLTLRQWAEIYHLDRKAAARFLQRGVIPGAHKLPGGRKWLIPATSVPALSSEPAP